MSIASINIKNYKSIRDAELEFGDTNILIGANGSGKSNLISLFKLLNNIMNQNLQLYVKTNGFANAFLYFGEKKSPFLECKLQFNNDRAFEPGFSPYDRDDTQEQNRDNRVLKYEFILEPTQGGGFVFTKEVNALLGHNNNWELHRYTSSGATESSTPESKFFIDREYVVPFFRNLKVFHFHDTGKTALVKSFGDINDNDLLREDARNLAAFLYRLSKTHPQHFNIIEKVIQSVAPFFNRFDLRPSSDDPSKINLRWQEKGNDDYFDANYLSDGTLRFICLAALFLQPEPPGTIIIDEPEIGLHPFAINKLAAIIKSLPAFENGNRRQVILATQSIELLNHFPPDDSTQVIVVDRENEQTVFKPQNAEELSDWLKDYSLGELWNMNIIGGRPK